MHSHVCRMKTIKLSTMYNMKTLAKCSSHSGHRILQCSLFHGSQPRFRDAHVCSCIVLGFTVLLFPSALPFALLVPFLCTALLPLATSSAAFLLLSMG